MENPYIYKRMKMQFGSATDEVDLPPADNNKIPLEMMDKLVDWLYRHNFSFRMTKDKICWKQDGVECLVELV